MIANSLLEAIRARAADPQLRTDMTAQGGGFSSATLDDAAIRQAELRLGFSVPSILRAAYHEIGNGGFGPGYGLLPLMPKGATPNVENVVETYLDLKGGDPEDPVWRWPDKLLPFCEWGCAIRSCVDCSSSVGIVVTFDPNARRDGAQMAVSFATTHASLEAWFQDWIDGTPIWDLMFEPDPDAVEILNPFTRKPISIAPKRLRRPAE